MQQKGFEYFHRFEKAGTFLFVCGVLGPELSGTVIVNEGYLLLAFPKG